MLASSSDAKSPYVQRSEIPYLAGDSRLRLWDRRAELALVALCSVLRHDYL